MAISVIVASELIFGALNKRELKKIIKDINSLQIIQINETISKLSMDLLVKYSLSSNLNVPDSLIAATALFLIYNFTP